MSELPANYATTVFALLEREAIARDPHDDGEGYGEYLIALMEGVLRLRDPRSLRGLALLGIQMSREAQEYVASQGAASIPYLDEAWARDRNSHNPVANTWAFMIGRYQETLPRPDRLLVMSRLFAVLPDNAMAFTWAASIAPLPEAIPLLEDISQGDPSTFVRNRASLIAIQLRTQRDQLSAHELLTRLTDWIDAFCLHPTPGKVRSCQLLSASKPPPGTVFPALETMSHQVDEAFKAQRLTAAEHRLLADNLTYLKGRS